MECKTHVDLPRPCPVDDRVIPLVELLQGKGEDSFNAVPHAAELLAICEGPDNGSFEEYIIRRLFHEMSICKADIEVHFHAVSRWIEHLIGPGTEIVPDGLDSSDAVSAMTFKRPVPDYKNAQMMVKSIVRLPMVAKKFRALIISDLSDSEISKQVREAVAYWDCPCAQVEEVNGSIEITHRPMEKGETPLKDAGYTITNIKALDTEINTGMKRLAKELKTCCSDIRDDLDIKDRSLTEHTYTKDVKQLSIAHFCYNVLAQMLECSSMAINDIFGEFSDFIREV